VMILLTSMITVDVDVANKLDDDAQDRTRPYPRASRPGHERSRTAGIKAVRPGEDAAAGLGEQHSDRASDLGELATVDAGDGGDELFAVQPPQTVCRVPAGVVLGHHAAQVTVEIPVTSLSPSLNGRT
jgi:hypothetical protein